MKMEHAEEVLLEKIAAENNQVSFRRLYESYFLDLYDFALGFVKTRELAEEVVSDVFCKVWENRSKLPQIANLRSYLFVSVRNRSLTYINQYLNKSARDLSLESAFSTEFAVDNFTPDRPLDIEEFHKHLDTIINALPHGSRTAFKLVKEKGMKYKEAAEVLGISVKTVENQVLKALRHLKPHFDQYLKSKIKKTSAKVVKIAVLTGILLFLVQIPDFF